MLNHPGFLALEGPAKDVEEYTGIPTHLPDGPLFIPPIGIGMHEQF